ncbi:hypothetical protein [Salmonella enterica subsp. enterica serovar Rissen]|nr:hypothetical protein [Salmonella enterica subsp. enterica serovar Rissen]
MLSEQIQDTFISNVVCSLLLSRGNHWGYCWCSIPTHRI